MYPEQLSKDNNEAGDPKAVSETCHVCPNLAKKTCTALLTVQIGDGQPTPTRVHDPAGFSALPGSQAHPPRCEQLSTW